VYNYSKLAKYSVLEGLLLLLPIILNSFLHHLHTSFITVKKEKETPPKKVLYTSLYKSFSFRTR
jgi:hypothetical protein